MIQFVAVVPRRFSNWLFKAELLGIFIKYFEFPAAYLLGFWWSWSPFYGRGEDGVFVIEFLLVQSFAIAIVWGIFAFVRAWRLPGQIRREAEAGRRAMYLRRGWGEPLARPKRR